MFRDTAVDFWLGKGCSLPEVSAMLGDTVSIVEALPQTAIWPHGRKTCEGSNEILAMSELLTVAEVAGVMKLSDDAVTRIFARLPGVIDLGRAKPAPVTPKVT